MENKDKKIKKENDDNSSLFLIGRKRNNSIKSEDLEIEIEISKKRENKNWNYCDYCNSKINNNLNNDDTEIKNYLANILFKENKNEFINIISDVVDSYDKEEKINFYKNIQNLCQSCIKTIFIEGGLTNILDKNKINNDELKSLLSDNKNIEEIVNDIRKDMEDLIIKVEKKLEINIICKIIQMKNKLVKCYKKLSENNIYLENNINSINKNDNENEYDDDDDDENGNNNDNNNNNNNEKNENYDEKKFNIDKISSVLLSGKKNTTFDLSKKKYTIFSKGKIYESKYENIPKNKTSKTFLFNSPNQIKNYIYNLPVLITNNSNIILKENNDENKDKIIYTLSDIKNLESQNNLRKSKFNSVIVPNKFQTLEIEKQISKIKEKEREKEKEKEKEKENILKNLYNKKEEIKNNNSKNELNGSIIKNINDNINANDKSLNNIAKKNDSGISNKGKDNIECENKNKNKNNIVGINNNNNNNDNLPMENKVNIDNSILIRYLISSSLLNKRLVNQIFFGSEQSNSLIPGISNQNLLEYLIKNNNNNTIKNNTNNNFPNLNIIQSNDSPLKINSLNKNLNSLNNNNINDNLNLNLNNKNNLFDSQNINIIPNFGACNNIPPFFNSSLLSRNNLNTFQNEISLNNNNFNLKNTLNRLNEIIGINATSGNLTMNSNIQTKTNLNSFNFSLNDQNTI